MRILSAVLLIALCLAGCNRGVQSKDAVQQAILDYLKSRQFNTGSMDVNVADVNFQGNRATAKVSFAPKGAPADQGMSMEYQLEQQGDKWVVVGRQDSGGAPHGGMMGGEPPAGAPSTMESPGGGKMPSPENLPPAGNKK